MDKPQDEDHSRPMKYRFLVLIAGAILIALFLVFLSLHLYVSSGASQLDLSRPAYENIREQAQGASVFEGFDSEGDIDEASIEEFRKLYAEKLKAVTAVDAFEKDVLSPENLQIDQKTAKKSISQ